MGNFLVCHTFAALVNKLLIPPSAIDNPEMRKFFERGKKVGATEVVTRDGDVWLIDNYVMIAPDVCFGVE